MSKRFPALNHKQITRVAKNLGFRFERMAKGSHEIWWRDVDKRYTTIPNHGGRVIKRRTLKAIIEDLGITLKDLNKK
ncbi:MAG: hypothetical protein A3J46_06170 [Candidatus Yanofskybacteria bacterium RIFCSPHIGHO2_02_FULL_41_11]|uniref:Addiction module toxin, HicA family n=1 Tax=Candidatus Yanofskybacteria bacterium RIFCSPHIGHO2_02_FULL_41_11 TaxID=1802675 RepID=A0A1F8F7F3_9BACT|nr:MAG: hypothetical protein A3J46_06170 [Candidatus Yanofskybacteria bacterium RIFCSPHIGHO2_02_FULL_41_11]